MIYWFSGTGNSARVAKVLAERLGKQESKMEKALLEIEDLKSLNSIGFIFPVYGWGLPLAVEQWIDRLPSLPGGFTAQQALYVYSVLTCGDDIGRTDALLRQRLAAKGWPLQAVFSVQMRNTYVCLPGFDTDQPDLVETKEKVLQERLKAVRGAMTQSEFATRLRTPLTTLGRYERGANMPDLAFIINVCTIFDVSPEWLLFGRGVMREQSKEYPSSGCGCRQCPLVLKELDEERTERRELSVENRQLYAENRKLLQENGRLREELARLRPFSLGAG